MLKRTSARLGLALLTSLFLLAACTGGPEPPSGFGDPMPSYGSPDH